jgi:hypothetical protein
MAPSFSLSGLGYESHPAFDGLVFETDPAIDAAAEELAQQLADLERRASLPSTAIDPLIETRILPELAALFERLKQRHADLPGFGDFADRLQAGMTGLIRDDLAVCGDRGTHAFINHSPEADTITLALDRRGYQLGRFDATVVEQLLRIVAREQKRILERWERDGLRDRESLSFNQWPPADHALLGEVFNEPALAAGLSNYMGARYMFMGTALELSVADADWWQGRHEASHESEPAAYYHLDMTSRNPKLICYLSDVDEATGPTSLLCGGLSDPLLTRIAARALDPIRNDRAPADRTDMAAMVTGSEAGRRHFAALPPALRAIGHFGNDVLAGSPQEAHILAHQVVMTGPAGSFVLFDGARVPHGGGIVKAGRRWALQCVYQRSPRVTR